MLFAQPELALGAEHALRLHAADLGRRRSRGRRAAWRRAARTRRGRPTRRVRRAAHDRSSAARPVLTRHSTQPVAVALADLALDGLDLADHHAAQSRARRASTLATSTPALTRLGSRGQLERVTSRSARRTRASQPIRGIFIDRVAHANCRRKRRSFSKNSRMSSMPYLQHRDALDAHAEREAGDLFGIVADVAQHVRMHHARAEDLEPARLLAHAAARRRRTGSTSTSTSAEGSVNGKNDGRKRIASAARTSRGRTARACP